MNAGPTESKLRHAASLHGRPGSLRVIAAIGFGVVATVLTLARTISGAPVPITLLAEGALVCTAVALLLWESARRRRAEVLSAEIARLIASTSDAIYSADQADLITSWNHGAERLYGFSAEEAVGECLTTLIAGDWVEERAHLLHQIATSGHAETLETQRRCKNGRTVEVSLIISPLHDARGNLAGTVTVARDITARKAAEAALETSEARYRRIAANVPGMVYQYRLRADGGSEFPFVSEGCRGLYGYSPEEISADPALLFNIVSPDERASLEASIAESARTLEPWRWAGRIVLKWGEVKWLEGFSRPERLPNGDTSWDGVIVDVTERRRAHEELANQQQFFSAVLESLHEGLMACDGSGTMTLLNRAMRGFYGLPEGGNAPALWLGKGGFFQADGTTRLAPQHFPLARACAGERVREAELVLVPSDGGEPCTLIANGQPLYDRAGRHLGAVVAMHDITEKKRAEAMLRRSHEELERRVAERTAQLCEAKDAAEAANTAKDEFLSRMSHELRTPLNAILGFTQLLELDSLGPQQADAVGYISRAGEHLLRLVNDVLDLSGITSGRLAMSAEPVEVHDVVWETLCMAQRLAAEAGVRLPNAEALDDSLRCRVLADPQRLRQVLLNLVTNAVKYNRAGGEVRITAAARSEDRLRIEVADTGVGIAPEKLDRLFSPFDRLDMEKQGIEGTGIGLAISRRLVEAMGGGLTAEAHRGEGSIFAVELPIAHGAAPIQRTAVTMSAGFPTLEV